ncbi:DEAD/DEAH box helicase [Rubinisphaera sp.]|uniref:DEAD/DEAH box helicase n=1 Tax=Rubinisphaera sp. TaxID=2024857 RepID=UPI000C0DD126|nr:DEAD/DEAH box helicase [Rubinisphaera sp.]MBV12360.1 DEAD/DEAH box helicase [Rubinisphaera sp.]
MKTFAEIDLIKPVQRALADEKYETPTPIQAQTIPAALDGKDVLGCAQTGTGKTAAFALPILNQLGKQNKKALRNRPQVLVLAPTRELAIQIGDSFTVYGKHLTLKQALVYGGVSQYNQVRALNRGAHILVATPGRLLDLMNQGHIELDQLEMFVLDEADRMLDMGFLPDLKRIISKLPEKRQSLFFSATISPKIVELTQSLLRNPVSVNVTPEKTSVEKIEQRVVYVERGNKQPMLEQILGTDGVDRVIVFTKTKRAANQVAEKLQRTGIASTAIHGNKSQAARQRALDAFRRNKVKVLVATDVAARGIDIDDITHVVNFDLPIEPENYVHRIGRTGRANAEGTALSFCAGDERRELRAIERLIGQKLEIDQDLSDPNSTERNPPASQGRGRRGGGGGGFRGKPSGGKFNPRKPFRKSGDNSSEGGRPSKRRKPARKDTQRSPKVKQST